MSSGSNDGDRYWRTEVSEPTAQTVNVRGYPLEGLIGMSFTATTFLLVKGRFPSPQEARVLDCILTSVLDYGLEKPGTVAARYAVSGNPNLQAGLAVAVLSAGEHTLSTEYAAKFITESYDEFLSSGADDLDEYAGLVVRRYRTEKRRIPGFGHPLFKRRDPRAEAIRTIAVDAGFWNGPAELYEAVHRSFIAQPGKGDIPINDVGAIAAVSVALGFTPAESAALAILGTLPGVAAHLGEEWRASRTGRIVAREDVDYELPTRDIDADLRAAGWHHRP